jgi:hypothetical protein
MRRSLSLVLALVGLALAAPSPARAQARRVEVHFTPTLRAQIAIWIEDADGAFVRTLRLTQATAYRGIGNRPGASQMNSGFRWPYGRREGVLPVWAHRRAAAPGAQQFPRVIFQDRRSEGDASRTSTDYSEDSYYCLSFQAGDEQLDAVACASTFNSDKGRFLTEEDARRGYFEPVEIGPRQTVERAMPIHSLYPPRRDITRCATGGCFDHPDVAMFASEARRVMPEIDAVTMATPPGDAMQRVMITWPEDLGDGDYRLFVEVNTELDYNEHWSAARFPTPLGPDGSTGADEYWDWWAQTNGFPYRGQPSVVYEVPFRVGPRRRSPADRGAHGLRRRCSGLRRATPGRWRRWTARSPTIRRGARAAARIACGCRTGRGGTRVRVVVPRTNICDQPDAPAECGRGCDASRPCAAPLICGPARECVGICDVQMQPDVPASVVAENHAERTRGHIWARMRFEVPASVRGVQRYEVRVGTSPITDAASFAAARPAKAASLEDLALRVPVEGEPGDDVEVELGGLLPETHYWVGVRAVDTCNSPGGIAVAEVTTTPIYFTTVSPCFVATAAYGSALDARVGVLRRFRDRHLRTNALGRALVSAYETVGPIAARWIAESEERRAAARALLEPVVTLLERW